jgi:transketolase
MAGGEGRYLSDFEWGALSDAAQASRGLILDMVDAAGSGHLGMALGCGEIGAVLFGKFLRLDPSCPDWLDRDRFVLSAGHGSAFLYAWLHLAGFPVSLEQLKNFRRGGELGLPGHPERNPAIGVECAAGPLGQGIGQAVGMALSQKMLRARMGQDGDAMMGRILCLAGDGCVQEGVGQEALALAGIWGLDNLILLLDDNGITLDGESAVSNVREMEALFAALSWRVQRVDGHHLEQLGQALIQARAHPNGQPQLIIARTVPGKGVPAIEGSQLAHGNALNRRQLRTARRELGFEKCFTVPSAVRGYFTLLGAKRAQERGQWQERFGELLPRREDLGELLHPRQFAEEKWFESVPPLGDGQLSLREAQQVLIGQLADGDPTLISGSADVFSTTRTAIRGSEFFSVRNPAGRNVQFGIREHAMAAVGNGMACEGIFRPILSTFLSFSDYLRPALRLSALCRLPLIYVFTHDSLAVGGDGPTHQPVEMLPGLRALPNLDVVRPADGEELVGAYALAMGNGQRPTALILPRQTLPSIGGIFSQRRREGVLRGGYVVREETSKLRILLLATGSELHLALEAAAEFPSCRVVSMPCTEAFERQPSDYRDALLPPSIPRENRLAIEAAGAMSWMCFAPPENIFAVNDFGRSADGDGLLRACGICSQALRERLQRICEAP